MPLLGRVIEKYKDSIKLVSKNFPIPSHKYSKKAAAAALAAGKMGKYWEFHEALLKNMRGINDNKVREIAIGLGLDADKIQQEMKSKEIERMINRDVQDALKAGADGTPTVFINGRLLRSISSRGFQDMIDDQLKRSP